METNNLDTIITEVTKIIIGYENLTKIYEKLKQNGNNESLSKCKSHFDKVVNLMEQFHSFYKKILSVGLNNINFHDNFIKFCHLTNEMISSITILINIELNITTPSPSKFKWFGKKIS